MSDVWVICIGYDYGVHEPAGWFPSEESATGWIQAEHDRRRRQHEENRKSDPSYDWGDYEESHMEFYAVRLAAHPERKGR